MLTGDRVDNIIGIHGIGDKTADKLLLGKSVQEMEDIIINKYRQEFKDDYMKRYAENKKLLWILREPLDGVD
jgi:5'-3' exonuclease